MDTNLVSLLCSFSGRINRAKYWLAAILYIAAFVILGALAYAAGAATLLIVVLVILYIPMIISGIAVGIKRLHDRDKSGWWLLVFYAAPLLLDWIGAWIGMHLLFSLASFAISIWMIVELGFLRGTAGPNRYGPDPLAGSQ
ncbi:MAG TPA: DUF805 domain-containing protein [Pseudolabrys sp.]|jgi:uncharacterized membrane protein YhaH (DUF805 family)|nr:DUF805 domain-containing protein [Pseudolabrys sp.]